MPRPKHRFLVTGCAGFIGGHMLERLLADGHEVVGIDDFSTGKWSNMEACLDRFRFIEGTLCDPAVVARAVAGVEYVIHLASIPSVPRSVEKPLDSAYSTVIATVALLEAAADAGVRRVVQASSSSVYGDVETERKSESLTPDPISPYAVAKLSQERYAKAFCRCRGLDSVSLRYFNVFGPRQNPDGQYAAVIPKFVAAMLSGARPVIYGDGDQIRDFTHVDNVVEANLAAALAPNPLHGGAVNIAGGEGVSVNRLVRELNRLLGADIAPIHAPARVGEIRHSRADIRKAKELFGFAPRLGFAEGLAQTVRHYQGRIAERAEEAAMNSAV